jgi:hypothetical protein
MKDTTETLVLDLVEWVAARPRAYNEVMDAGGLSCASRQKTPPQSSGLPPWGADF